MNRVAVYRISDLYHKYKEERFFKMPLAGFMYVAKGDSELYIDFKGYKLTKGAYLSFEKEQFFETQFLTSLEGFVVLFTANFLEEENYQVFKKTRNQLLSAKHTDKENVYGFLLNLYKEYKNNTSLWNQQILKRQLEVLLLKVDRLFESKMKFSDLYLKTYLHFEVLVYHKHKKTRNALDYADDLEISYKHLNEISKKVMGVTAKDIINDFLILSIKKELLLTKQPIKELTEVFGFDEPTNFVKYFKRYAGITPKEFRKKMI